MNKTFLYVINPISYYFCINKHYFFFKLLLLLEKHYLQAIGETVICNMKKILLINVSRAQIYVLQDESAMSAELLSHSPQSHSHLFLSYTCVVGWQVTWLQCGKCLSSKLGLHLCLLFVDFFFSNCLFLISFFFFFSWNKAFCLFILSKLIHFKFCCIFPPQRIRKWLK